ncbi:MAG: YggS family pyridoxal phosphate-dependent enzyme [Clostridium sp.]|nr:YggS family pyridoxal phosphate-dependent enzyme [Clostridium sp.]
MSQIARNLEEVRSTLPKGVEMVAVSKFHPVEALMEAYAAGQRIFGESRQQELLQKAPQMPEDVRWHFIGHLQTNKVRSIIGKVAMIESVDTEKLLRVINDEAARAGITANALMQAHVAKEETKFGFLPEELEAFFAEGRQGQYPAVKFCGIMGMASNTDDMDRVREDFQAIAACRRRILELAPGLEGFDTVSMGMSHDYPLAIECGANLVRIGTAIFGEREY